MSITITCNQDLSYICNHHNFKNHSHEEIVEDIIFTIDISSGVNKMLFDSVNYISLMMNTTHAEEKFKIVIPKGFITDGYSMPNGLGWLVKDDNVEPSVLHDYFCVESGRSCDKHLRHHADVLFYHHLLTKGEGKFKSWLMFKAVNMYGKFKFLLD